MLSVLMTSTMKSEPGTPPMRLSAISPGVWVSSAATCVVGGSADGRCGFSSLSLWPIAGAATVAAPVASTPVRNLRRSLRAMVNSSSFRLDAGVVEAAFPRLELYFHECTKLSRCRCREGESLLVDELADLRARHDGV